MRMMQLSAKGKPKPKMLFVAPHLPRFDKYSGDLRMYRLLAILSKSHEVVFLAQGETGSGAEEEKRYLAALEELGIAAYIKDFSLAKILTAHSFHAAILEFYYFADHYIPRIRIMQPACRVIIDTVDLHYRRQMSKYLVTKDPEDLLDAERTKKEEIDTYQKADVIVTVTDEDAEILRAECPGLTIRTIPNIHDPDPVARETGDGSLLFVGGFRHEPNVDAVLYFCEEVFPLIRSKIPDCTLTVVGSNPPEEVLRFQGDGIKIAGFVPSLDPFFEGCSISVAPLRFGAGMKGKVGEAMSRGLPVVTTSIGAQGMGLVHRHNAMLSDSAKEFADSVEDLIRDGELYRKISKNALDHIRDTCGTAAVEKRVGDLIEELSRIPQKRMGLWEKFHFAANFARILIARKLS